MPFVRNQSILAVDVGGSALRAGLVRANGTIVAMSAVGLRIDEPRAGWAELDPQAWWHAFLRASNRLPRAAPGVAAVCICAMTRTQVMLDRNGRTVGPAMLFRDRRAGFDTAGRMAWIERNQPARFAKIARVVEPKDYLAYRLTGEMPPTASVPWRHVGNVQSVARLAGVPVFAGGMDTWASAIGAGAVEPGQAYDVAGTTEAVGLVTARPAMAMGLRSFAWTEDTHQLGGPTQAGADCARWSHHAFRVRGTLADAIARTGYALRRDAPVFLPYLAGERAPVWSGDVRGAFHRIDRSNTPDDFLWSTMEGVAHAVADIVRLAEAGAGIRASEVRACGGGAQSDAWCALKADVLGIPVIRSRAAETGLIGAAMAAAVGLGWYPDLRRAGLRMAKPGRRFMPHARVSDAYAARAATYAAIKRYALELVDDT